MKRANQNDPNKSIREKISSVFPRSSKGSAKDLKKSSLSVVVVSTLYPNPADPVRGIFTAQIVQNLSRLCNVSVVSPLPWFPKNRFCERFKKWSSCSRVSSHYKMDGIEVYYPRYFIIPKVLTYLHPIFMLPSLYLVLRRLKRKGRADLINTHWIFPDGVASTRISKYLCLPQVLVALGCDITHYPNLPYRLRQISWALRTAASVLVVSKDLGERVRNLGAAPHKIKLAPDGVDFERFYIRDRKLCRNMLGLPGDKKFILHVASLDEVKGTTYLVHAAAKLRDKIGEEFHIYIIGEGELKEELKNQSQELGVAHLIDFAGRKPHDEVSLWMNAANVFCLTSIREGRPNVLLESMACGTPVVATAVGGVPEIVNSKNGILAKPKNPADIAQKLTTALNFEWERENIANSISHLTWDNAARTYYQEFVRVLEKSHHYPCF